MDRCTELVQEVSHVQRGRYLLHTDMQYSTVYKLVTQRSLSQLILWVCYLSVILETNASLLPEIISHKGGRLSLTKLGSHYCGQIALVDNMFCRYSAPEHKLHSDLWRQFEAEVLQEICRTLYTSRRPAQQHSTFRAMA